jgi:PPOX class probable FMN-dependent enzyme
MSYEIQSEEQLRELMGNPVHEIVVGKSTPVITQSIRRYIELSPFACLATYAADGSTDISPRGDPPGFVDVQDEKTLILPERPGNRRLDSIINIISQPKLSLLFMIPGVLETVRVNGTGVVSTDPALLARSVVNGKLPELVVIVTVEEALGHCSKALRRSKLWQGDYLPENDLSEGTPPERKVPTLVELMTDHIGIDEAMSDALNDAIEKDAVERLY